MQGSGFRVQGAGFREQGAGCRVQGVPLARLMVHFDLQLPGAGPGVQFWKAQDYEAPKVDSLKPPK